MKGTTLQHKRSLFFVFLLLFTMACGGIETDSEVSFQNDSTSSAGGDEDIDKAKCSIECGDDRGCVSTCRERKAQCRSKCDDGDSACRRACLQAASQPGEGDNQGACPSERLYQWSNNLWPDPTNIPVCFWDEEPSSQSARLVRTIVTEQYARAGLGFSGWKKCGANDQCSIKVSLRDRRWGEANVGAYCNNPDEWDVGFPGGAANIRYYALHEFGHVLGMNGDFNQPKCTSVMCNTYEYSDFGATLTSCDVNTVRKAYSRK